MDWGKNSAFNNYSALFNESDRATATYFYADGVTEVRPAFVRPLRTVVRRLEMMGYTLTGCRSEYCRAVEMVPDYYPAPPLSFDEFASLLRAVAVPKVRMPQDDPDGFDLGELAAEILTDPEFTSLDPRLQNMRRDVGTFFENLDPLLTLRLLAENPCTHDLDVVWRFADVVEGGWGREEDIYQPPSDWQCLVVTEGSSDGHILRRSLELVAQDVADFFDFVDMTENYPFTGTGNLYRFCQGLARIHIQNRVLVVLDNDTVGREAYGRITSLDLPDRMHVALLPDLEECRDMATLGPGGGSREDVNGRAVSIECFLDLSGQDEAEPVVRWTSFVAPMNDYQGELLRKEQYTRSFFDALSRGDSYDLRKLTQLWDHLVAVCVEGLQNGAAA